MREKELTLEHAISIIKATQTANKQIRLLVNEQKTGSNTVQVDALSNKQKRSSGESGSSQTDSQSKTRTEPQINKKGGGKLVMCSRYCGKRHAKGSCPAYGKICQRCKKRNHFATVCKSGRDVDAIDENSSCESYEDENLWLGEITVVSSTTSNNIDVLKCNSINLKDWLETLIINNKPINVKVDTGAQANVMSESILNKNFPNKAIKGHKLKLYAYGGTQLPSLGKVTFECKFNDNLINTEFFIVPLHVRTVLGLDSCVRLGLVRPHAPDSSSPQTLPQTMTDSDQTNSLKLIDDKDKVQTATIDRQQVVVKCEATDTQTASSVKHDTVRNARHTVMTECVRKSGPTKTVSKPGPTKMTECVRKHVPTNTTDNVRKQQTVRNVVKANPSLSGLLPVLETYADVFDDTVVGCLRNYEYDIKLKDNAVPVVHAARKVALTLVDGVTNELNRMEKLGVIAKVDTPTDWVNSMVVVQKPDKLRICLDPSNLNQFVRREHTHLPTTEEILSRIKGAKVFTKIDAKDGYWQIPLTEKSSYLTTFNTPNGRYRYTRLPFGLNSANEIFQKQMSQAFENIEGVIVIYNDILIYGNDDPEHDERLRKSSTTSQRGWTKAEFEEMQIQNGYCEMGRTYHIKEWFRDRRQQGL